MSDPIYLDHNATTPIHPEVREAMLEAIDRGWGNPSSGHVFGERARAIVERARAAVAASIGAEPDEIVFTSGGTEASNIAIHGVIAGARADGALVRSAIEHPATTEPCAELARSGRDVRVVPVDRSGVLRLDSLEAVIAGATLASVMHANNETGVVQPIAEVSRLARAVGAWVHCDGAQAVGKIRVDVRELGIDLLTIAAHKLYGPKGVGALYVRRGVPVRPLLRGAPHERGLRAGTENVVGIAGLGAACALAERDLGTEGARVARLRDRLTERLRASVAGLVVHGETAPRLPNTASVRFPGVSGPRLLAATRIVAASTGAACHAGSEAPSAVITAMGVSAADALGTVRLSLGRSSREPAIDAAAAALAASWRTLRDA